MTRKEWMNELSLNEFADLKVYHRKNWHTNVNGSVGNTVMGGVAHLNSLSCCCLVTKSFLTLCDPRDCSPPASSFHGIFQARILKWVVISPGDLPNLGIEPASLTSPALAGGIFNTSTLIPCHGSWNMSSQPRAPRKPLDNSCQRN